MHHFPSTDIVQYDSCHTAVNMKPEQSHYAGYAQELREKFQSGLLSELQPFPQFVVWKYTLERGKLKKRPFNPKNHLPAKNE